MPDRKTPPTIHDFETISLVPPQSFRLTNGIDLKVFENQNLDLIHLLIKIRSGALYEPQRRIASACYSLLRESHPAMTSNETDAFFDYYGSEINVNNGINFATFKVLIPKRNCLKVLPVVAELLSKPVFKEENWSLLREKMLRDWEYQSQKVDHRVIQLLFHSFYKNLLPFGKLTERSDFDEITLNRIATYHRETCCAENIRIFAAGNIDDEIRNCIMRSFSPIARNHPAPALPTLNTNFHPQQIVEEWPQAMQTAIMLCKPILSYNHPDAMHFRFLQTLFCNYFGSRLMQNLREKNGYTYGVSGNTAYCGNDAIFYIESEVNNNKTEAALQACFDEMKRIQKQSVSDEEMMMVRNYMLGSALRNIDGTIPYMMSFADWDDFGEDENHYYRYIDTVRRMTASHVRKLAARYLSPDSFTIILVGGYRPEKKACRNSTTK